MYAGYYSGSSKKRSSPAEEKKVGLTWEDYCKWAGGRLKWDEEKFLSASVEFTFLSIDGYMDERIDEERIFRRHGLLIASPWTEKGFNIYKYWPIAKDDNTKEGLKQNQREKQLEKLRKFKEQEAINRQLGITTTNRG
jgi:hypothetical protein